MKKLLLLLPLISLLSTACVTTPHKEEPPVDPPSTPVEQPAEPTPAPAPEPIPAPPVEQPAPPVEKPVLKKLDPTMSWSLQYKEYPFAHEADAYVGDLWGMPQSEIDRLNKAGKLVFCYFSSQYEHWRPDAKDFPGYNSKEKYPNGEIFKQLDNWDGEYFVNIKSKAIHQIMFARINYAKKRGCKGVDPDNLDGYHFGMFSKAEFAQYYKILADYAHSQDMYITLKNSMDLMNMIGKLPDVYQNEQCHEYEECDVYDKIAGEYPLHVIEYAKCPTTSKPYPKGVYKKGHITYKSSGMGKKEVVCWNPGPGSFLK